MTSGRATWLVLAVIAALLGAVPAARAADDPAVSLSVDRAQIRTGLGKKFVFRSTVRNDGSAPVAGLIAHLNVLSLRPGTYVDPEDWSSNRTRYLPTIPPGGTVVTTWQLQAVNDGRFGLYVAVLPDSGEAAPSTTKTIRLAVTSRRTLNPSGMVPVALGIPALLGLLAVGVRITRRG